MEFMHALLKQMAQLRDLNTGCPWCLRQDFSSLTPHTIEEAYEVTTAVEDEDFVKLKDELGDLLFQIVFYAQLAEEKGYFKFDDVAKAMLDKNQRRGFKTRKASEHAAEDAHEHWDRIKRQETPNQASVLEGITHTLPAIQQAHNIQRKAARVGFDWPDAKPVFRKVREEITELEEEYANPHDEERLKDELGDVLFSVVNLSRHLNQDPEQALRFSNKKFIRRFQCLENMLQEQGDTLENKTLAELETLWQQAKVKIG